MNLNPHSADWIIPAGTQVVINIPVYLSNGMVNFPAGAVGVITTVPHSNSDLYKVRFPNGMEEWLYHDDLTIQSHFVQGENPTPLLREYVIYRCIVGSRAYGLDNEQSDTDYRGFYLPPADLHWSLFGVADQIEIHATQEQYWEIQKFITLALRANPNVLECLYTPLVEHVTPLAQELLDLRSIFLTKLVYQTYNGYVMSQFRKLAHDQAHGGIRWKHAMHLIRLLLSGITTLREGFVPVQVATFRDQLLAIRNGELDWAEINAWRLSLHQEFDRAFEASPLPERPDYEKANAFLIRVRRSQLL